MSPEREQVLERTRPCHYLGMTGGDDLRHNATKRLPYKPDFLSKMMQKFSHCMCELLVVGKADGIVEGKDRELLGQAIKMRIKQIGQTQSARQQSNGRLCLWVLVVAVGKGFPAGQHKCVCRVYLTKIRYMHRCFLTFTISGVSSSPYTHDQKLPC